MKCKLNSKKILAILFLTSIVLGGILTLALSPVQILGGLVRGYISAPAESTFLDKIGCSFQTFDSRVNEYFVLHDLSIHVYGGIQRAAGRTLINDVDKSSKVLRLNNGYLTFLRSGDSDLNGLKQYLLNLKETCNSVNSELLYVQKPNKGTTNKELLPAHYPYSFTSNFETIKPILEENDISIIDLNQIITKENIDKYSLFFKTDHHWTPQAGVWAAKNICNSLNAYYGWEFNLSSFDIEHFSIENHPRSFLGSEGKRVGALYTEVDDFAVVKPLYKTNFTVEMQDIDLIRSGGFDETMLFTDNITPDNLLNKKTTAYMTYMQGNHPLVSISNHLNKNGKTALLILDSYGCVVAPYLAIEFQQLDCIDIRYYTDSVEDYIQQTSPDVVIYAIDNYQQ